jgi:hypothetical protein
MRLQIAMGRAESFQSSAPRDYRIGKTGELSPRNWAVTKNWAGSTEWALADIESKLVHFSPETTTMAFEPSRSATLPAIP